MKTEELVQVPTYSRADDTQSSEWKAYTGASKNLFVSQKDPVMVTTSIRANTCDLDGRDHRSYVLVMTPTMSAVLRCRELLMTSLATLTGARISVHVASAAATFVGYVTETRKRRGIYA